MDFAKIIQSLRESLALFEEFSDSQLEELLGASKISNFEPKEGIIEFNEKGLVFGILLEGEIEASVTDDNGDRHVLGSVKAVDVFGEMSLMTGNRSIADVIALTACKAILIPQSLFSSAIAEHPKAVTYLSKKIVARLKKRPHEEAIAPTLKRGTDPYGLTLKTDIPMRILAINSDPVSLKYRYFDTADKHNDAWGKIEHIGNLGTLHTFCSPKGEIRRDLESASHAEAFSAMIEELIAPDTGVIDSLVDITAVGHRIVHGGEQFTNSVLIDDEVIETIKKMSHLAPLHNPVNLVCVEEAMKSFPSVPHIAVFDTAFHQTLPVYAYLYGLPYEYFEEKRIRRYGFHGASHAYVSLKVAEHLERPYNELETIVCHLGGGASVCAVDHGRSIDTSMGLTPNEGLIMGTRCGDVDPAILLRLMREENLDADGLNRVINCESGLLGLSGISGDMIEVAAAANEGHRRSLLAIKTFSYRVRKYIGAYAAAMGGVDAVAFTGGIGQGSAGVRSLACQGLHYMGIQLDEKINREACELDYVKEISTGDSAVRVLVVPTDEERLIARETIRAMSRSSVTEVIRSKKKIPIPLEVSAHHLHLAQEHVNALFGKDYELTVLSDLSQPGQYACNERVNLIGPKGTVKNVRVLGPTRKDTQVEIALTEQFKLGISPPIRESGQVEKSPGVTLEGPDGRVELDQGVICALRHIHMTPEDALGLGLKDKDMVRVRVEGSRELIFGDVLVRVNPDYRLAMHIDTDEANAAHIKTGVNGYIDSIQNRR